jgi:glycosyltransferase involved in cell wall biosynthesis
LAKARIAFVCSGGAQEYWINLANAVSKKCELHLYLPSAMKGSPAEAYLDASVQVHFFRKHRLFDPRSAIDYLRLCRDVFREAPAIVHFPGGMPVTLPLFFPLLRLKLPVVVTLHEPTYNTPLHERLVLAAEIGLADAYFVAAPRVRERAIAFWPSKAGRFLVVPFGPFAHYLKIETGEVGEEADTALFIGSAAPHKGVQYAMSAADLVSRKIPSFKLLLAGRGIEAVATSTTGRRDIELHQGFVSDAELCRLFRRARVIVLPHLWVHVSGAVYVSQAFKKPVIATRVGALPDVVQDGRTGLIVEPASAEALAAGILRLLQEEGLYARIKDGILEWIAGDGSWEHAVNLMLDSYVKVRKRAWGQLPG